MSSIAAEADGSPCEPGVTACHFVWDLTESEKWSSILGGILDKTLQVVVVLLIAVIARSLLNRAMAKLIDKMTAANEAKRAAEWNKLLDRNGPSRRSQLVGDRSQQRAATLKSVMQYIVSVVVYVTALLIILAQLGLQIGPLLASAGVVGLAIGFGAQNLVKDYVSGIFMLLEDQYGLGDWVNVGDAEGTVEDMGLRTTTLRDLGGTLWYVRNGEILRVGNSSQSWAYVVVDIPLSPSVNIEESSQVIMNATRNVVTDPHWQEYVLTDPEYLGVQNLTVDEVTIRIGLRSVSDQQWALGRELRRRIGDELHEAGISQEMTTNRVFVPRRQQ
ncbi:mechanosensitive ion channel family protein [Haloglycomyces albus]|uniref:mechanosensitive ion channel family protein n=1 Tax=Haloglycomyces albus TaxID=526067 RepID=UPI00046CC879|nr:mechanosensitive ion channel family protein [Haloglycomyces albus]